MTEFINDFKFVFLEGNRYQFLLKGLGVTLEVSLVAVILGVLIGLLMAIMKMSEVRHGRKTVPSVIANIYIDIIRGTPSVLQLLIMYFVVFHSRMGILAAIVSFGMNSGAYVAEIIRAGIMAVDRGQMEAGRSLGLSYGQTMRYIIIPQAIKNILPALGNEFILLIKETSILGYIAIYDLTKVASFITSRTYKMFLPLIGAAVIYYIVIKILTIALGRLERRFRKNDRS
ncbi:MAG TPA: amino acid ABC transporter permease [Lachnospiraceae bacterium]|jgi:His/Glu/Gln/Arg/opine family amino acid ABC transporter permease subunit|nr:amino acid ABC transporter permease [Lachnospiraceae bacterium]